MATETIQDRDTRPRTSPLEVHHFYVVVEQPVPPGANWNAALIPAGSVYKGWPIAGPFDTREVCIEAQHVLARTRPDCTRLRVTEYLDDDGRIELPRIGPTTIVVPAGTPHGWWHPQASHCEGEVA